MTGVVDVCSILTPSKAAYKSRMAGGLGLRAGRWGWTRNDFEKREQAWSGRSRISLSVMMEDHDNRIPMDSIVLIGTIGARNPTSRRSSQLRLTYSAFMLMIHSIRRFNFEGVQGAGERTLLPK